MTRDKANELAEAVWTRLLARWAMIGFSIIGSIGIPISVWMLKEAASSFAALKDQGLAVEKQVALLRADWKNDQTADAGRFALQDLVNAVQNDAIRDHAQRLQWLEARRTPPP